VEELTFAWGAARVAARDRETLVLCREIEVGALLARRRHPAFLFEAHTVPRSRLRRSWMRRACSGALGVAAITGGLADDLAGALPFPRSAVAIVPDAFEAGDFRDLPSREEARRRLGISPDEVVVAYTGHLFAWKGAETLLAAAARAPALRFRLVGGLPEDVERARAAARALGASNADVVGHRPPAEIPLHLAAADVVAIPNSARSAISARHTSPLKLFEAMAAGRAIVASDLPSLREVLEDGRTARLVPPDDPDALARACLDLAARPREREALGTAARAAAEGFTYDARARRLLELAEARLSAR
jgi:glycosyltransferase involved in cell wall biosynthesis